MLAKKSLRVGPAKKLMQLSVPHTASAVSATLGTGAMIITSSKPAPPV